MPVKRCPMCHLVSHPSAWRCDCGYEFGKRVDQTLALLRDQRTTTGIALGLLITLDLAIAGVVIVLAVLGMGVFFPVLGFGACLGMTAKVARKLAITRSSMRQLAPRPLPKAMLHKG
jgi:hypothetical protein